MGVAEHNDTPAVADLTVQCELPEPDCFDGVGNRYRRMSERGGVENDAVSSALSLLYPFDEIAFGVGLAEIGRDTELAGSFLNSGLDLVQGLGSIYIRLAHSQQV